MFFYIKNIPFLPKIPLLEKILESVLSAIHGIFRMTVPLQVSLYYLFVGALMFGELLCFRHINATLPLSVDLKILGSKMICVMIESGSPVICFIWSNEREVCFSSISMIFFRSSAKLFN